MPRVMKHQFYISGADGEDKIGFELVINVSTSGIFYTYLPPGVVSKLQAAGVNAGHHHRDKNGFFESDTADGLKKKIKDSTIEYSSRELIFDGLVIKYLIQTTCEYSINSDGKIIPDEEDWGSIESMTGNLGIRDTWHNAESNAIKVYAKVFSKTVYKYKSGAEREEYGDTDYEALKLGHKHYYRNLLNAYYPYRNPENDDFKEVEYTEATAKFFVDFTESICAFNEGVKDFLEPDSIKMFAEKGIKLLGERVEK